MNQVPQRRDDALPPETGAPGERDAKRPPASSPSVSAGEGESGGSGDRSRRLSAEDLERHYRANESSLRASLRLRLTNELDVEDCLNRVFEKLWERGGELPPAVVRSWLWIVARNEAAAIGRAISRRTVVETTAGRSVEQRRPAVGPATPLDGLLRTEELERLGTATRCLTAEQSEVLRMRFLQDLPFREIASSLGIPIGTALTRARTGLMKLRREFENRE